MADVAATFLAHGFVAAVTVGVYEHLFVRWDKPN